MSLVESAVKPQAECTDRALLDDWHVVGAWDEFPVGKLVPVQLLGRDLVAWRESNGDLHVWEDLCVHRGTRLSLGTIKDDKVICPYHGWNYNASGDCVLMPAAPYDPPMKRAQAVPYRVQQRYGWAWVCLGTPELDIPVFPEWEDASFRKVLVGPYPYRSSGYRAVENFMDATHLPFVHAGLNGLPDDPDVIEPYQVIQDDNGIATSEIKTFQPFGDPRGIPVIGYYAYRCIRPLVGYFSKRVVIVDDARREAEGKDDDRFCVMLTAQPVDETHSIIRQCIAINFKNQPSDEEIKKRQDIVLGQDRAIVESQRPERIPSDLRLELHHRTDLLGQRYRKWLRTLGITYGTI
jgi:phenylpropionate dioxygenase-like ring-hydroxylating dioxygenase large terminal subunit